MRVQKRWIGSMAIASAVACCGLGAGGTQGAVLTQLVGGDTTDGVNISSLGTGTTPPSLTPMGKSPWCLPRAL